MDPGNNCKVDSDENWISFAEEMGVVPSETRLWLPDEISNEFSSLWCKSGFRSGKDGVIHRDHS